MYLNIKDISLAYNINFDNYDYDLVLDIFNNKTEDISKYNLEDPKVLNILGFYYLYLKKDKESMKECYLRAIELGDVESMKNLGDYYNFIDFDYEKMIIYYNMAIKLNYTKAMINLSNYYMKMRRFDKMKKYSLMATKLNDTEAINNLGYYYFRFEVNYSLAKYYFELSAKLNNASGNHNLGAYYLLIENDLLNGITFLLKALKLEYKESYSILLTVSNKLLLYNFLKNEKDKNYLIEKMLLELENSESVINFKNKLENSKIVKECCICFENRKILNLSCGHELCEDCFCKVNKCYLRCY
jgi:TPR repeat protein